MKIVFSKKLRRACYVVLICFLAAGNIIFFQNCSQGYNLKVSNSQASLASQDPINPIANADQTPAALKISLAYANNGTGDVNEGDSVYMTASLSAVASIDTIVNITTKDETATAGSDYVSPVAQVTIPAGQSVVNFSFATNKDSIVEPTESFQVVATLALGGASASLAVRIHEVSVATLGGVSPAGFFVQCGSSTRIANDNWSASYAWDAVSIASCDNDFFVDTSRATNVETESTYINGYSFREGQPVEIFFQTFGNGNPTYQKYDDVTYSCQLDGVPVACGYGDNAFPAWSIDVPKDLVVKMLYRNNLVSTQTYRLIILSMLDFGHAYVMNRSTAFTQPLSARSPYRVANNASVLLVNAATIATTSDGGQNQTQSSNVSIDQLWIGPGGHLAWVKPHLGGDANVLPPSQVVVADGAHYTIGMQDSTGLRNLYVGRKGIVNFRLSTVDSSITHLIVAKDAIIFGPYIWGSLNRLKIKLLDKSLDNVDSCPYSTTGACPTGLRELH